MSIVGCQKSVSYRVPKIYKCWVPKECLKVGFQKSVLGWDTKNFKLWVPKEWQQVGCQKSVFRWDGKSVNRLGAKIVSSGGIERVSTVWVTKRNFYCWVPKDCFIYVGCQKSVLYM